MSNIQTYLQQILDAVYGEEVRGSIHDAIATMNSDLEDAVRDDLNPLAFKGDLGVSGGTNNNLNSLVQTDQRGIWRLLGGTTYTNVPSDFVNSKQAYLIMYAFGTSGSTATVIKQEIHYFSDSGANANTSWSRVYLSSEWQDWHRNVDDTLNIKGAAADSKAVGGALSFLTEKTDNCIKVLPNIDGLTEQGLTYKLKNGSIVVSGTSTVAGVLVISSPFTLEPGTYQFGARRGVNSLSLQLRKWQNNEDAGAITATAGFVEVTISERTTCAVRLAHASGVTVSNAIVEPELVLDNGAGVYIPGSVALDFVARAEINSMKTVLNNSLKTIGNYIENNADLNDFIKPEFYTILPNRVLSNAPDNYSGSSSMLITFPTNYSSTGAMIYQIYMNWSKNTMHQRFKEVNGSWTSWKLINSSDDSKGFHTFGYVANNADLNTFVSEGFYTILGNRTLVNAPDNYGSSSAMLAIFPTIDESSTAMTYQVYMNWSKNTMHQRFKEAGGSWTSWKQVNAYTDLKGFCALGYIENNVDLNAFINEGFYTILSNRTLVNAPDGYTGHTSVLMVFPTSSGSTVAQLTQVYLNITGRKVYARYRPVGSSTFTNWELVLKYELNPSEHGVVLDHTSFSSNYSGNNYGTDIDILAYNVEHYEHFTGKKIGDENQKDYLVAFKKLLQWVNPLVCMISEDRIYMDSDNTKTSEAYIFNNMFPTTTGSEETTIKSKIGFDKVVHDMMSANRPGVYAIFNNFNGKKILFYTAHLTPGSGNYQLRLSELEHIFNSIESENPDAYIIAGDFNTDTQTDRDNLVSIVADNGAKLGNGGYLGWIDTMYIGDGALDNLIVSSNVFINRFEVLSNWGDSLYSDHLPVRINVTVS